MLPSMGTLERGWCWLIWRYEERDDVAFYGYIQREKGDVASMGTFRKKKATLLSMGTFRKKKVTLPSMYAFRKRKVTLPCMYIQKEKGEVAFYVYIQKESDVVFYGYIKRAVILPSMGPLYSMGTLYSFNKACTGHCISMSSWQNRYRSFMLLNVKWLSDYKSFPRYRKCDDWWYIRAPRWLCN